MKLASQLKIKEILIDVIWLASNNLMISTDKKEKCV